MFLLVIRYVTRPQAEPHSPRAPAARVCLLGNLPLGLPPQAPAWPRAFPTRLERGAFSDGGVCPEGASAATTACQAVGLGQNNSLRQLCSGKAPETGGGGLLVQISDTSQLPAQTAGPESNGSVCWGRDLGSHGVAPTYLTWRPRRCPFRPPGKRLMGRRACAVHSPSLACGGPAQPLSQAGPFPAFGV